jgi:hypothetical protein
MTPYQKRLIVAVRRICEECPEMDIGRAAGYCEEMVVGNRIRQLDDREFARGRKRKRKAPELPPIECGGNVVVLYPDGGLA